MGGEHYIKFHSPETCENWLHEAVYDDDFSKTIPITERDRHIWPQVIRELILFANLQNVQVKHWFVKGNPPKYVSLDNFHLGWGWRDDPHSYDVYFDMVKIIATVYREKFCGHFDRCNRELTVGGWDMICIPFIKSCDVLNYKYYNRFDQLERLYADMVPFDLRYCIEKNIRLPLKVKMLLEVFPIDVANLIAQHLYCIRKIVHPQNE